MLTPKPRSLLVNTFAKTMLLVVALPVLTACQPQVTPTPVPTAQPTATSVPPTPTIKVWPTSSTPAPEEPVIRVGDVAVLQDTKSGVSGKAIMAGLQTIILNNFTYDGSCATLEVRLAKAASRDTVVGLLGTVEKRAYSNEALVLTVPSDLKPGAADSILLYCTESATTLGWGTFK
jgi:hypothetical protein